MHDAELTTLIEEYGQKMYESGVLKAKIDHALTMIDVLKTLSPGAPGEDTPKRRGRPRKIRTEITEIAEVA